MSNCLWEILIPERWNDSTKIRLYHHHKWDDFVQSVAGGLTILKTYTGQWLEENSGEIYHEPMIPVRIMCNKEQIVSIIDFTIKHYRQKAVMAYKLSDEVIVRYDSETTKT